ncbi:MAG: hypothetical protein U9R17_17960 [Thermodesulfobacteriota bacterium]|nr:hypothetical protein [Thermodesulfobacteriota bacterium]
MVNSIHTTALTDVPTIRRSNGGVYPSEVKSTNQTTHKLNKNHNDPEVKKDFNSDLKIGLDATQKNENNNEKTRIGGETRKIEVTDGELTVSVYNTEGKLIRMIPPGYVPPDKAHLNMFA